MESHANLTTAVKDSPFARIIEQNHVRNLVFKAVANGRLAHGFLFTGQQGTGRMAMALELARVINCENPPIESVQDDCNCRSCRLITAINHPNLTFIFPRAAELDKKKGAIDTVMIENLEALRHDTYAPLETSRTGNIRIEQIRELRNRMSLKADGSGVRVTIIKPAENLNPNASNALLKLLEEPPDRCCIILITASARGMLPTIVSRCQKITFSPLSDRAISESLTANYGLAQAEADLIAGLSSGGLSTAIAMIGEDHKKLINETLEFLRASVQGQAAKIYAIADVWSASGAKSEVMKHLELTSAWLRDALMIKASEDNETASKITVNDRFEISSKIAVKYTYNQLINTWSEIETARQTLMANAMPQLVITSLALKIGKEMR